MRKQGKLLFSTSIMCLLIFVNNNFAQDIIIKKDNEQIKAKIIEIGTTEIKFKYFDAPDGPTVVISKKEIKSLKIEGKADKLISVNEFKDDPMSVSNSAIIDKTSSIKFNFFSPLSHHLAFSYEWMIRPGFNWEAGLGIVGPGVGATDGYLNYHPKGVFVRTGPKFLLGNSSDIEIEGARYAHPLKGRYFKIETIIYSLSTDNSAYQSNFNGSNTTSTTSVHNNYLGIALDIQYGRQFIFGNFITVGWYMGVGYGMEDKATSFSGTPIPNYFDWDPRRYSHTFFGEDFPMAFTGGFNIGYIFRTPYWLSKPRVSNREPSRHSMLKDK